MTLKERIENNLTLYTLGLLLAGFLAGISTYKFFLDSFGANQQLSTANKTDAWQETARKAAWIESSECPAYPLELKLTSPGTGAVIASDPYNPSWLRTPIVISTTRPLPEKSSIGLIVKPADSSNFYVIFPGFTYNATGKTFRRDLSIDLPFKLASGQNIQVRALVIDDKNKIGERFSSVEQIKGADASVFISDLIEISVK